MRKSYKFARRIKEEKSFFHNYQIRAPQLAVIDETGAPLGVLDTRRAVEMALEKGLDLVEVAPNANPPVAKIMNFGSFQYQREKLLKKQHKQGKTLEVKSIRLSTKIGEHDEEVRVKQAEKFLEKGHKVKVEIILRGREMQYQFLAKQTMNEFMAKLTVPTQVEQNITRQGNKVFLILMPIKAANT